MELKHFKIIPATSVGIQLTKDNLSEVAKWCNGILGFSSIQIPNYYDPSIMSTAYVGDYIMYSGEGSCFVIDKDNIGGFLYGGRIIC